MIATREARPLGFDVVARPEGDGASIAELVQAGLECDRLLAQLSREDKAMLMHALDRSSILGVIALEEDPEERFAPEAMEAVIRVWIERSFFPPEQSYLNSHPKPEYESMEQPGAFDDSQRVVKDEPEDDEEGWTPMEFPQYADPVAIRNFFFGDRAKGVA